MTSPNETNSKPERVLGKVRTYFREMIDLAKKRKETWGIKRIAWHLILAIWVAVCLVSLCFTSDYMKYGINKLSDKLIQMKCEDTNTINRLKEYNAYITGEMVNMGDFCRDFFGANKEDYSIQYQAAFFLALLLFLIQPIGDLLEMKHRLIGVITGLIAFLIICFTMMFIITICGYDILFITYGLLQAITFSVTIAFRCHRLDLKFMEKQSHLIASDKVEDLNSGGSEGSNDKRGYYDGELVKARLQLMHDKWSRLFMWFLGIIILVVFIGSLNLLANVAENLSIAASFLHQEMLIIHSICLLPVAFLGIGGQIFFKMDKIEKMLTEIKNYDSHCPWMAEGPSPSGATED